MHKFVILLPILALAGCGGGGGIGLANRGAPDEFAISRSAPLVVPPDFALSPPKPGEARPIGQDAQSQAVEALFGPGVRAPARSPAEQQLLDKATGTRAADPSIRSNAGDPQTPTVNKGTFLRELIDAPAGTRNAQIAEVTTGG